MKTHVGSISIRIIVFGRVSDQLAGGLQNTEQVFDNVSYTKRWYANVFAGIPDYSGIFESSHIHAVNP